MGFPLIGAGLSLVKDLVGAFTKGAEESKKAKAQREAQEKLYGARKGTWDAGQARRGSKLSAVQDALGKVGGALPEGAPDYSFDPAILAEMQKALPFGETVESQVVDGDPRAGQGASMLDAFLSGVGNVGKDIVLGDVGTGSPPPTLAIPSFQPDVLEGSPRGGSVPSEGIDWDSILKLRG